MYLSLHFFKYATLKFQLGVCISDHMNKSKLSAKQKMHNHKFLGSCQHVNGIVQYE